LLSKALKELQRHLLACFRDFNTILIFVKSEILKEVSQMTFIIFFVSFPLIDVGMGLQVLASNSITSCMGVNET
jgi:hypothetical protein